MFGTERCKIFLRLMFGKRGFMFCVVLSKIKGTYVLRHIIYDISDGESMTDIQRKYYRDYYETDTDEFHLCGTKAEVAATLAKYAVG